MIYSPVPKEKQTTKLDDGAEEGILLRIELESLYRLFLVILRLTNPPVS